MYYFCRCTSNIIKQKYVKQGCENTYCIDTLVSLNYYNSLVSSAFYQHQLVRQLHPSLEKDFTIITQALCKLNYCNTLHVGLPLETVQNLFKISSAYTDRSQ